MLNNWVIMNTKQKMNIHQAIKWFDIDDMVIIRARRCSNRGANEDIYILGAGGNYGVKRRQVVKYKTDTGNGYGGTGELVIADIVRSGKLYNNKIMSTCDIISLNEKIKLPIWVFK